MYLPVTLPHDLPPRTLVLGEKVYEAIVAKYGLAFLQTIYGKITIIQVHYLDGREPLVIMPDEEPS